MVLWAEGRCRSWYTAARLVKRRILWLALLQDATLDGEEAGHGKWTALLMFACGADNSRCRYLQVQFSITRS